MGRIKKLNQEGFVQCKVCEKLFKVIDKQFEYGLATNINQSLSEWIEDMTYDEFELLQNEPFYKHLNSYEQCPKSRCELCHNKPNCTLKLFETRSQTNAHTKKVHKVKDVVGGRTGYSNRIREEVNRQTIKKLNEIMETQKDFDIIYPIIEVRITGFKGKSKDEIQKETIEEKNIKKEETKQIMKKKRIKKAEEKILKQLEQQKADQLATYGNLDT